MKKLLTVLMMAVFAVFMTVPAAMACDNCASDLPGGGELQAFNNLDITYDQGVGHQDIHEWGNTYETTHQNGFNVNGYGSLHTNGGTLVFGNLDFGQYDTTTVTCSDFDVSAQLDSMQGGFNAAGNAGLSADALGGMHVAGSVTQGFNFNQNQTATYNVLGGGGTQTLTATGSINLGINN